MTGPVSAPAPEVLGVLAAYRTTDGRHLTGVPAVRARWVCTQPQAVALIRAAVSDPGVAEMPLARRWAWLLEVTGRYQVRSARAQAKQGPSVSHLVPGPGGLLVETAPTAIDEYADRACGLDEWSLLR